MIESVSKPDATGEAAAASLDTSALLAICEAYYQRLLQGDQFDVGAESLSDVAQGIDNPAVKGFSASRLDQLNMIGKPAPAIQGPISTASQ